MVVSVDLCLSSHLLIVCIVHDQAYVLLDQFFDDIAKLFVYWRLKAVQF
jgi:hypothetical protein